MKDRFFTVAVVLTSVFFRIGEVTIMMLLQLVLMTHSQPLKQPDFSTTYRQKIFAKYGKERPG